MSNIYLPQPGTLTLPGIDDIEGNAAGTSGGMATGGASASLPQPGSLVLPRSDGMASDSAGQGVNLPAVDTPPEMASSVNGAPESDMPPLLQPGPSPVDFLEAGIGAAGVGGFEEPETLRRPTSFDRAAFMMRGISNVSLDDAVLAYLAKTTVKVEFDVALRHIPTTKKVLNAIEWFDRLDAMDTQRQEALLNKETATLVKEDISAWQKFGDILSAPSNLARDVMSSKTMAEALAVLPRAPFNISESTYQGVQALGGLMQLAGLTDAGQTVEQFGRYHADKAREILRQLSPVGGRISSDEILNDPWRLFSDEGLAWLIGSVGDTGAKQLPSILGYMSNPLLGAALGGASEGVAFYEQLRQDNVSVYNALLQAAAFGGATGLLDRIGLDAMLPQYAPRTANHILDRAMGVVGDRLDRGIARLPGRVQPVANAVRAGAVEGVTEYLENPIQGALEGVAKEEGGKDIWGRTKEGFSDWTVILPAAVLGGGIRSLAGRTPPVERRAIEDSGGSGGDDGGGAPFVSTQETVSRTIDKTLLSELKTEIEEVARYEQAANERIALGEALKQAAEVGDATRVKSKNAQAFEAGFRDMVPERYATLWLDPETVVQYAQGTLGLAEGEAVPAIAEGEQAARLSQIGLNLEQLQEAVQSGAPLAVETIAVASMDAGPVREVLFDAARQAPDGMTAQEAARFEPEKLLDGAVKRVRTAYQERQDVIREERRLVDEIAAVGFPEHVARDYATVLRANAEAYQGRYGADAAGLLRQISVENRREGQAAVEKGSRGAVSFGRTPEGEARAIIHVFNGRDLSTVLHESSHIWMGNLETIADGGASTALQSFDLRVSPLGAMPDVLTDIALRAQEAVQSEKPAEALRSLAKEARQVQDTANAANDDSLSRMAVRVATELNRLRRNLSGMEQARQDIRSLREYAGVSLEGPLSQEERRVFYERVAAGAEAYFMEGKAPNAALQRIFDAFRNWLTAIYKSAKNLFGQAEFGGFELTDDVRAVFDRMLSTDDRLAQARRRADLLSGAVEVNSALSDNLGEAVSQEELDELNALLGDVERAATEQMDAATLKDRKKRLAEFRKIAAEALEQEPFWQAVDYLSGKDIGLNRELLEVDYGKDSVRDLMRVKRSLVRSKGGVQLDVVATELGYPDADTLWNEMQDRLVAGGQTKQGEINRRAQEMLDAEDAHIVENVDEMAGDAYGRYLDAVERAANRMLGKARGMSHEAMRHFAESVRTPRGILADRAATEIATTRITNIRPDRYNAALRKAQREIARAMREEQVIVSLRALDEARLSNELYVQAVKTRRWVEDLEARSRKAARIKPDTINELAREGLRRVLSRFDLANVSAVPYVRGDEAISLREIVTALSPDVEFVQTDDGSQRFASGQSNVVLDSFPGWLLDDRAPSPEQPVDASGYIHHRQLTPAQLRDVENLIKYLEHRGREMSRANKASEAARVEAQAVAGAAPMQALKPRSIPEEGSRREKWRNLTSRLLAEFDNLRSTFLRADAFSNVKKSGKVGFNEEMLLQPLLDGESQKKVLWRGLNSELAPHIEQMTTSIANLNKKYGEKLGSLKRRDGTALLVPEKMREIGRSWSFERVFGMALQLGNRSNMDRLVSGFKDLDMETVAVLLGDDVAGRLFKDSEGNPALNPLAAQYGRTEGVLTGADWKAVQGIWDSIESLWPDTVQTHEQLFGFAPQKIDAEPISLMRDGERVFLKGGYFPAKYDPKLSDTMAARQEVEDILRDPNLRHGAPSAKRSHTKARAEGAPGESLRLDLGQIMQHLEEATTFIALGPTVRHVDRVTRNPVWRSAYVRAFGEQEYNAIRENLKSLVQKERTDTAGQDFANMARRFLTYNALSWNMNTVMMQTDALFKSAADQGWKPVLDGLGKLVSGSPISLIREVEAASPYMESRSKNLDRDLAQSVTDISKMAREKSYRMLSLGKVKVGVEQAAELGMKPMQAMDQVISTAIWIGAYQAKMRELGVDTMGIDAASKHHSAAVRHADNMVKRANPDYDATSRTKFQRHPFYSMTNMFASATTLIFQRQRLQAQALRAGETTLPEYAVWQFNDTLLPALAFWLFSEACIGAFGDDDKKRKHYKKDWVQRYMEETLDYAAPSVPVAGPVLASLLVGGQRSSSQTVLDRPLQVFGRTFAKTRGYLSDERGKNKHTTAEDVANAMIDTVGFVTKIPTQRFRKYGENVLNLME